MPAKCGAPPIAVPPGRCGISIGGISIGCVPPRAMIARGAPFGGTYGAALTVAGNPPIGAAAAMAGAGVGSGLSPGDEDATAPVSAANPPIGVGPPTCGASSSGGMVLGTPCGSPSDPALSPNAGAAWRSSEEAGLVPLAVGGTTPGLQRGLHGGVRRARLARARRDGRQRRGGPGGAGKRLDRLAELGDGREAIGWHRRHRAVDGAAELGRERAARAPRAWRSGPRGTRQRSGAARRRRPAGGPASISKIITPSEKMSARASTASAEYACSGAMYSGVPMITPGRVRPRSSCAGDLELGDAEVEQLEQRLALRGLRDHHVVGLEIAVDDAGAVRGLDALEHLHRVLERVARTRAAARPGTSSS